jgi:lipopolysaccharide/colanic/teichoic acid biosynthesis glycosyltransferase
VSLKNGILALDRRISSSGRRRTSVYRPLSSVFWPAEQMKRLFDITFAALGLLVLSLLFLMLAVAVKLSSRGPALFCQQRIGKNGRPFRILKFRTMVVNAEKLGPGLTRGGDSRITAMGYFLRKTKLDELPQLWNVLVGDMSFVGPRPEVPRYVEKYTAEQRRVLALKPGITDVATLEFRNEEELLKGELLKAEILRGESNDRQKAEWRGKGRGGDAEMEEFYMKYCVPRKIELNLAYAARANLWEDIKIIVRTLIPSKH